MNKTERPMANFNEDKVCKFGVVNFKIIIERQIMRFINKLWSLLLKSIRCRYERVQRNYLNI